MSVPKINFKPLNVEEKKHLKNIKKILSQKRSGDWGLVAGLLNISKDAAIKSYTRVYSNNHFKAVEALESVIENRKKLLRK